MAEIDLSWSASTDNIAVAGYRIRRDAAVIATVDGGTTSYRDVGVPPFTSVTYTVEAFDASSNYSAESAPANATSGAGSPPVVSGFRVGMVANVAGWGTPMQTNVLNIDAELIREDRGDYAITWANSHSVNVIQLFANGNLGPYNANAWAYELDNEPYNSNFYGSYNTWAHQMLTSAIALRGMVGSKPIICPFAQPWSNGDVNGVDGVQLLYNTVPTIFNYIDGLAIHPYSQPFDWTFRLPILDKWRSHLNGIGHGTMPFWVTEIGWPTGGVNWSPAATEAQQSAWTAAFIDEMLSRGDVEVVMVYDMQDFGPRDSDSEHWFGILHTDFSHKPAWSPVHSRILANP